jgi:hypothetical protein
MTNFHGIRCYGLQFKFSKALPNRRYYGSWLRAFIGDALCREVCVFAKPQCPECALREQCAYPQIFKRPTLPPYWLHEWKIRYAKQHIEFTLILLKEIVNYAEVWIHSLANTGGLLQVRDVATNKILFIKDHFKRRATLSPLNFAPVNHSSILIKMLTPLVTKSKNPDFFFVALSKRLNELIKFYGNAEAIVFKNTPPWQVNKIDLHKFIIPRSIELPYARIGQIGTIRLSEVTREAASCLAAGQYLHAGGDSSMGCGHFSVTGVNQYEKEKKDSQERRFVVSRWG